MRFDYVFILILPNCACAFREQEDREQALQDLKSGSVKILIATGWLGFWTVDSTLGPHLLIECDPWLGIRIHKHSPNLDLRHLYRILVDR